MSDSDLTTYVTATATLLTGELPLQSVDSAITLVYAYISDVGGWVPDNPSDPTGPGVPFNNATEAAAASAIAAQQINNVYDLNFSTSVTIECQFSAQLGSGLSLSEAAASMAANVTAFITDTINNSPYPLSVTATQTPSANSDRSLVGGNTTQAIREAIVTDLSGDNKIVDYKEIALQFAISTHGLDDTWNVQYVYTQSESPIVIVINKYTDDTYATLDSDNTTTYVFTMSPTNYGIVAGVTITA